MLEEDDYPPYPSNVVQMTREVHQDEGGGVEPVVVIIAGIVAGVAAAALLVVYGLF